MSRVEYLNDPDAPRANSIVVAVNAFVRDERGKVLMIQRSDNGLWAMPGGGQDVGEYVADTAVRETKEETGYDIEVTGLVGVYSNPNHVIAYTDGEVRQQFALCFRARLVGGELETSSESPKVKWVEAKDLDSLNINPSIRLRIEHSLCNADAPYIG